VPRAPPNGHVEIPEFTDDDVGHKGSDDVEFARCNGCTGLAAAVNGMQGGDFGRGSDGDAQADVPQVQLGPVNSSSWAGRRTPSTLAPAIGDECSTVDLAGPEPYI
jgi:hypothetical protein